MSAEKVSKKTETTAKKAESKKADSKSAAMALHIGKLVRKHLEEVGMTKSEFARRLDTSPQNIYGIFKRKSIDTNLLKNISTILNYDFFQYYASGALYVSEDRAPYGKERVISALDLQKEMERLKKDFDIVRTENNYLKEILQLMKDKQIKTEKVLERPEKMAKR